MTWNDGIGYDGALDNKILKDKVGGFNQNQPTDIDARRNYLFNKDLDLGRPGDASYEDFVANPALFTTATRGDGSDNESFDTPSFIGNDTVTYPPDSAGARVDGKDNESFDTSIFGNDTVTYPTDDAGLARKVAEGMAKGQAELMAKGNALQERYDAQEAIQNKDNLFNEHFDRNQAEYKASLFDGDPLEAAIELGYPGATQVTDFADALYEGDDPVLKDKALRAYKKILAEDNVIKTTGHSREEPNSYNMDSSLLDRELGTGDAEPHQILPRVNAFHPPRPDNPADITGRTAYEHPGARAAYADFLNSPDDSYEKELHLGQIAGESTSNLTATELSDNLDAITAKYKGSTTETSEVAELKEIINVIASQYGGLPADSYAVQDEGTDTGESLFQNVAEDIPLSVFNPMDRVVMQAEAQAAQVAKAQAAAQAQAAAEAEARRNPPRPTPVPTYNPPQKNVISKPSPKPGGRAGAGATSQAYKTFARNYGGRYGL